MTKAEAIRLFDSEEWKQWSDVEKVRRQLFEERAIMPFPQFKAALERVLNHSVHTYQLGDSDTVERLKAEFNALHPIK